MINLPKMRHVENSQICKGLIFRGYNAVFKRKKGHYEQKQGFRLLKRDSCPGCDNCGGLLEYADETICDYVDSLQNQLIVDGAKYELTVDYNGEFYFTQINKTVNISKKESNE